MAHLEILPILINTGKNFERRLEKNYQPDMRECFLLLNSVATVFEENKNPAAIKKAAIQIPHLEISSVLEKS